VRPGDHPGPGPRSGLGEVALEGAQRHHPVDQPVDRFAGLAEGVVVAGVQAAPVVVEGEIGAGRRPLEAGERRLGLVERPAEALGVGVDEAGDLRAGDRAAEHEQQEHQVAQHPHSGQRPRPKPRNGLSGARFSQLSGCQRAVPSTACRV